MKNVWLHRMQLFKRRLRGQGIFWCWRFYYRCLCQIMFAQMTFGRRDVHIFPDARLRGIESMRIGRDFSAGRGLWLEAVKDYPVVGQIFSPKLIIGDRVCVGEYVHIGCNHRIVIGDDVLMGSKIYITDHNHGIYHGEHPDSPDIPPRDRRLTEGERVEIGARCWIGEFVTILPGVSIGEGCIIGSHSTVTHDIPANSIAVGSPAKVIKNWNQEKGVWEKV